MLNPDEDSFVICFDDTRIETVGDWAQPQIEQVYATGAMPSMLPALGPGSSS